MLSDDMKELLSLFRHHGVRYVVVGGHAVNYYGYVRATQDIDVLVYPSADNAKRIMLALNDFGFGGAGIPQPLFEEQRGAVHLGEAPNRIDLLTSLKGVSNDTIFDDARRVEIEGLTVDLISLESLLTVKRCSDRPRDQADADELEKINRADRRDD
jgi:predicted nucleotidyltransferase